MVKGSGGVGPSVDGHRMERSGRARGRLRQPQPGLDGAEESRAEEGAQRLSEGGVALPKGSLQEGPGAPGGEAVSTTKPQVSASPEEGLGLSSAGDTTEPASHELALAT